MIRKPLGRAAAAILTVASLAVASLVLSTAADADEGPVVQIGDVTVIEGDNATKPVVAKVPITLSEPAADDVKVTWTISGGTATAGADYKPLGKTGVKTATIKAGKVSTFASVAIYPDLVDEVPETIEVSLTELSGPGITISGGAAAVALGDRTTGTVTIVNEDDTPGPTWVSIGDATVVETRTGMAKVLVPITLSDELLGSDVQVSFSVTGGSATVVDDFKPLHKTGVKTATIKAGKSSGKVALTVYGDAITEGLETIQITIGSVTVIGPDTVVIDRAVGTVTILDAPEATTTTAEETTTTAEDTTTTEEETTTTTAEETTTTTAEETTTTTESDL